MGNEFSLAPQNRNFQQRIEGNQVIKSPVKYQPENKTSVFNLAFEESEDNT